MAIGLLIGLSVNFRIPNLFPVGGLLPVLPGCIPDAAEPENFMQGLGFGMALLLGIVPTLVANAINAGARSRPPMAAPTPSRRNWISRWCGHI